MVVAKGKPLGCDSANIGCVDQATVGRYLRLALVIHHPNQNIGSIITDTCGVALIGENYDR